MTRVWLQYEDSIDIFPLDEECNNFDWGTPKLKFTKQKVIRNGSKIDKNVYYEGRNITFSKFFLSSDDDINALNQERENFLDWMTLKTKKLYCYRYNNNIIERIEVLPNGSGTEEYENEDESKELKFSLESEWAFFENIDQTNLTFNIFENSINSIEVFNPGEITYPVFEFIPEKNFNFFQITSSYGRGFSTSRSFAGNEKIIVDCLNAKTLIGNTEVMKFFNTGTFLKLEKGKNIFDTFATNGELKISFTRLNK